ncbi:MaoC/PaaZ C-terminal domain-containing protein [Streptomyces sp. NPDC049837]|uniref:MaoC/PaaZ C-terminal domain-containing protein n=1 Tax=Streptomyces sp. NPDC049837 TaxID=3155277 RepID=UPI003442A9B7
MTTTPELTRTARRTATAGEIAAYRAAARAGLPGPVTGQASPVHAFVLAHTVADRTVRSLIAGEEASVVHLGQDIRLERPVRPGEPVTVALDVLGARREPRGTRVAVRTRLTGDDGVTFAELVTSALLVGASGIEPFGDIPSGAAPAPAGPVGEPATATHRLTTDGIRAYAHASGDLNPIHLDPETARAAGFDGVIAHGMSVVALVCEEIADRYADGDIARVRALGCRFSGPVPPDEPLDITLQPDAGPTVVRFTCRTPKGPAVKAGWARLSPVSKERTS